jgi:membrane protein YdbS with pleckstrin-like domain
MRCSACGNEVPKDAQFCPQCGTKQAGGTADAPRQQPQTASTPDPAAAPLRRRGVADVPEETLWEGRFSPKAMLGTLAAAVAVTFACVVAGALWGYWLIWVSVAALAWLLAAGRFFVRRWGISYKMTNQMFYHRTGILSRTVDRIEAIDIDDITWHQGLIDRMADVGSIVIKSRDRSNPQFTLIGIDNVENVARLIDKARRAERMRRGFLSVEQTNVDLGQ